MALVEGEAVRRGVWPNWAIPPPLICLRSFDSKSREIDPSRQVANLCDSDRTAGRTPRRDHRSADVTRRWATSVGFSTFQLQQNSDTGCVVAPTADPEYVHLIVRELSLTPGVDPQTVVRVRLADVVAWSVGGHAVLSVRYES